MAHVKHAVQKAANGKIQKEQDQSEAHALSKTCALEWSGIDFRHLFFDHRVKMGV